MAVENQDFSFVYPGEADIKRQAYRVHYPGMAIHIQGHEGSYPVLDLSPAGLAFRDELQSFTLGQEIWFDLFIRDRVCIQGIKARIVRIRDTVKMACTYEDLTRQQERLLDKLTLEIQKRLIDQRKRKQQEGNAEKPNAT